MSQIDSNHEQLQAQQQENYSINCLADELRADRLCTVLLKQFHRYLLEECNLEPLEAGSLAAGADYFLRDFMISNRQLNIFAGTPDNIRQFAGHWYIISNLEPNLKELRSLLQGTEAFYRYCSKLGLIRKDVEAAVAAACNDLDYYEKRIEGFLDISGDGFLIWEKDCPLD